MAVRVIQRFYSKIYIFVPVRVIHRAGPIAQKIRYSCQMRLKQGQILDVKQILWISCHIGNCISGRN